MGPPSSGGLRGLPTRAAAGVQAVKGGFRFPVFCFRLKKTVLSAFSFAFTENRKLKTENHKKKSPIAWMELPLPSGVA
jgi:hypothetical protein